MNNLLYILKKSQETINTEEAAAMVDYHLAEIKQNRLISVDEILARGKKQLLIP